MYTIKFYENNTLDVIVADSRELAIEWFYDTVAEMNISRRKGKIASVSLCDRLGNVLLQRGDV